MVEIILSSHHGSQLKPQLIVKLFFLGFAGCWELGSTWRSEQQDQYGNLMFFPSLFPWIWILISISVSPFLQSGTFYYFNMIFPLSTSRLLVWIFHNIEWLHMIQEAPIYFQSKGLFVDKIVLVKVTFQVGSWHVKEYALQNFLEY